MEKRKGNIMYSTSRRQKESNIEYGGNVLSYMKVKRATEEKRNIMYHEFYETSHSVTFYYMKKDSKRCCVTTMPESIHTKDDSKRSFAFAFIFGVN